MSRRRRSVYASTCQVATFDPLTLGEFGVDGLERLVAQRAQALAVFAKGLDDLRIHPRLARISESRPRPVPGADSASRDSRDPPGAHCLAAWLARVKTPVRWSCRASDHGGRGIAQQIHGGMEFDRCGLDRFEAPGKHLAQGVVDRKRTAILDHDVAKLRKGSSFGEPEDFQGQLAKSREAIMPMNVAKWGFAN